MWVLFVCDLLANQKEQTPPHHYLSTLTGPVNHILPTGQPEPLHINANDGIHLHLFPTNSPIQGINIQSDTHPAEQKTLF